MYVSWWFVFQSLGCVWLFCDQVDCSSPGSSAHGILQARILGVGCHFLLQGIFPTQGLNLHFLNWLTVSLPLSHQGSPSVMISYIPSVRMVLYTSDNVFFLVYVVWRYMISTCLPFVMLILPYFSTVWMLSFSLATNKQPVVRCFKALQISHSLSKLILQMKLKLPWDVLPSTH